MAEGTKMADVDGVEVEGAVVASTTTTESTRGTPRASPKEGGSNGAQPEDVLPAQIEETYKAQGQGQTGVTYASHCRKFLLWLKEKSLNFGNMPPGLAQRYLSESYPNPITQNVAGTALKTMFNVAKASGIKFIDQDIVRAPTKRKREVTAPPTAAPGVSMVPPPGSAFPPPQMVAAPQPPVQSTSAMQPVLSEAIPVVPGNAPAQQIKPQAPAKPQSAFPSLGHRMRISRLSDGSFPGVPPGTPITIGQYQKEQIEQAGSLENFLMVYVRPTHGPFPGQPPAVYRIEQLDVQLKPMPGHLWDVPIAADVNIYGGAPGQQPQQQPQQLQQHHNAPPQFAPTQPQPGGVTPHALMERLVDKAMADAQREREEYDRKRRELEDQRKTGALDPAMFAMMMAQLQQPKGPDIAELRRQLREELASSQPMPAATPTPSPMDLAALMGPPRPDPGIEALTQFMRQQAETTNRLLERVMQPQPQKDPMESFAQMMALMKGAERSDPLRDQLAALTLKQLSEPTKTKTLQEIISEFQAIKALTQGDNAPPSASETILEVIGVISENADKLGSLFANVKSGAVKAAFAQQRQAQLPAGKTGTAPQAQKPAQGQPQAQQAIQVPVAVQQAVLAVRAAVDEKASDEQLMEAVFGLLSAMNSGGDHFAKAAERVIEHVKAATGKMEIQAITTKMFQWIGATTLMLSTPKYVERIANTVHANYGIIYGMLNPGAEPKVLADAAPQTEASPSGEPAAQPPADVVNEESGEPDEDEDEDEEDDEGEDEPETAVESEPQKAVGT